MTVKFRATLPIHAMLGASALSQVGNMLTFVAVPWFVLQTTGSAARTGIAGRAVALAVVLIGIVILYLLTTVFLMLSPALREMDGERRIRRTWRQPADAGGRIRWALWRRSPWRRRPPLSLA